MGLNHSPKIVTNGLTFACDMTNIEKSYRGAPTTNMLDTSMSIYNNVPAHVTATLVSTTEYYRGAVVWRLTLTPTTATGVSYLTAGNNPGIGVVTSGGGGLANRYTGHGIFYKSTVPMHSVPLFTNYSNIGGWGAGSLGSDRSVPMGGGWSRGEVIWFNTVTATDGKYWAINPATATLNVPIVIFWAGPFKEDRNDSTHVASYTTGTRSNTQAILDLTRGTTITTTGLTYSNNKIIIPNTNGAYFDVSPPTNFKTGTQDFTISCWLKQLDNGVHVITEARDSSTLQGYLFGLNVPSAGYMTFFLNKSSGQVPYYTAVGTLPVGNIQNIVAVVKRSNSTVEFYANGVLFDTITGIHADSISGTGDMYRVGHDRGGATANIEIYSYMHHNRALTAAEVQQNFNALRGRYGI